MAAVVASLTALPDADLRAMATYLSSFGAVRSDRTPDTGGALAAKLDTDARRRDAALAGEGSRLYAGACAACHEADGAEQFGVRPNLALNTSLFLPAPDNLLNVVLHGIVSPAQADPGAMPAFRDSLSDRQPRRTVALPSGAFRARARRPGRGWREPWP